MNFTYFFESILLKIDWPQSTLTEDHRVRINIHELINIIAHGRPVAGGFLFGVSGLPPQWKIVGWTMKNQTAAQVSADIFQKASDTPVERRSTIVVVSGNSDLEPGINTLEEGWKFEIYSWEHTLAAALSILRTENVLVHYLDQYLPQITYISREFKGDSANISDSVTKRVVFYMIPGCEPSEEWCREVENVTRWPFQYYWSSAAANNLVLVFRDSASFDIKTFLENVNKHPLAGMRNAELYHDSDEKEKRLCPNAFCCIYGVRCRKIHTDKENDFFRKNGGIGKDLRKVKPCNHYIENYGWCKYTKEDCNFAHGEEDAFCPNCGENGHYQEKCEYARKPFMAGNAYYNSTTQSKSQEPEVQAEDHKEQKDTLETQQMDGS